MTRKTYLIIKLEINEEAEISDIIMEMDYSIKHKDVKDTEVVGSSDDITFD